MFAGFFQNKNIHSYYMFKYELWDFHPSPTKLFNIIVHFFDTVSDFVPLLKSSKLDAVLKIFLFTSLVLL